MKFNLKKRKCLYTYKTLICNNPNYVMIWIYLVRLMIGTLGIIVS